MFVPSMYSIADVMAESAYTEEQVFDLGIGGTLVFLVVVPELGACRVPTAALSHFMAGADDYTAEAMPEHYGGALSGRWNIKRDRLRILSKSWEKWTQDVWEIDRLSTAVEAAPEPAPVAVETPHERRARWLDMFEAEEKRMKRGALTRLAKSEDVDRSNMRKDIDKAKAARDAERRAGGWTSQLVQDGKRKG